jgi:hypothetical protein
MTSYRASAVVPSIPSGHGTWHAHSAATCSGKVRTRLRGGIDVPLTAHAAHGHVSTQEQHLEWFVRER